MTGPHAETRRSARAEGRLDICFNAVGDETEFGHLTDLSLDEFMRPIDRLVRAQFLIATAVAP
jgi:hypothetical protein